MLPAAVVTTGVPHASPAVKIYFNKIYPCYTLCALLWRHLLAIPEYLVLTRHVADRCGLVLRYCRQSYAALLSYITVVNIVSFNALT